MKRSLDARLRFGALAVGVLAACEHDPAPVCELAPGIAQDVVARLRAQDLVK